MNTITLLLLTLVTLVTGQISLSQWNALESIYQNANGKYWLFSSSVVSWNFTTTNLILPCTKWQGIKCNGAGTNISNLVLSSFNVNGTLSSSIGVITSLKVLNISNNPYLRGSIPTSIQLLTSLVIFDSTNTSFSGKLCPLTTLTNLTFLSFSNNNLSSTIPSFNSNKKLQILLLSNNRFTGPIPMIGSNMVTVLNLGNNSLTSNIPSLRSAGFMFPVMKQFIVSNNKLTGSIPEFGLFLPKLELVDISNNKLTGTVDCYIWQISSLKTLLFSSNYLSGSISSSVTSSSLVNVDLSFNMFKGPIPSFIVNSTSLTKLAMTSNCFSGSIPRAICNANSLVTLSLDGIATSPYCNSIGPFGPVSVLYSSLFMKLEGSIPSCIFSSLSKLESLHLVGNGLTGTISDIIVGKSNLKYLNLANNRLTGLLPYSLQSSGQFVEIDLSNNKVYGGIEQLITGNNMTTIALQVNRLSGNIPKSLATVPYQAILEGNLFGCKKITEISTDISATSYFCASELYATSLITWLLFFSTGFLYFIWFYISRGEGEKYSGALGSFFTYISNTFIHPWVNKMISKFFSLSTIWVTRRQMIVEAMTGLQRTANVVEEKSVLYATYKYLEVQDNTEKALLFVLLSTFILFLPTYLWFKGKGPVFAQFSTFEYQYLFITTSAYLHGYKPSSAIFAFLTFVLIFAGVIIFRSKYQIKDSAESKPFELTRKISRKISSLFVLSNRTPNRDSIRSTISWARSSVISMLSENNKQKSRLNDAEKLFSANRRAFIIFTRICCEYGIQIANIFFSFGINAAYIYMTSFSGKYYSTRAIYTIQVMLAVSKVFLSECIVPNLCTLLKFAYAQISNDKIQQHALVMNLINLIFTPVLATIVVSKSCLYYTYRPYAPASLSSSFYVPSCYNETISVNGANVQIESCSNLDSNYNYQIVPNFYYSYQCGSVVLVSYLSPLVFVYIINGLVFPLFTFLILVLQEETLERIPFRWLPSIVSTSYIKPNYVVSRHIIDYGCTDNPMIKDEKTMARRLSDRKENIDQLFQPSQILQKYVAVPLTLMLTFGISSPLLGLTIFVAIVNQSFLSNFMIGKYLGWALKGDTADSVEINVRYAIHSLTNIIKEEDVRTLKSCWLIILFFIGLYWAFMFFDMVGDKWGVTHAAIVSSLLATLYPVTIYFARLVLQPFFDLTYTKIVLELPKDFEIKIDKRKVITIPVEFDRNTTINKFETKTVTFIQQADDRDSVTIKQQADDRDSVTIAKQAQDRDSLPILNISNSAL